MPLGAFEHKRAFFWDTLYILGLRNTKLELDKMIGRINGECNLENSAKANPLQQQENEMDRGNL